MASCIGQCGVRLYLNFHPQLQRRPTHPLRPTSSTSATDGSLHDTWGGLIATVAGLDGTWGDLIGTGGGLSDTVNDFIDACSDPIGTVGEPIGGVGELIDTVGGLIDTVGGLIGTCSGHLGARKRPRAGDDAVEMAPNRRFVPCGGSARCRAQDGLVVGGVAVAAGAGTPAPWPLRR